MESRALFIEYRFGALLLQTVTTVAFSTDLNVQHFVPFLLLIVLLSKVFVFEFNVESKAYVHRI